MAKFINRDPKKDAPALIDLCRRSRKGSVEIDARLWCLLHRVKFEEALENPLVGTHQVKYFPTWPNGNYEYADIVRYSSDLQKAVELWDRWVEHCLWKTELHWLDIKLNSIGCEVVHHSGAQGDGYQRWNSVDRSDHEVALAVVELIASDLNWTHASQIQPFDLPLTGHRVPRSHAKEEYLEYDGGRAQGAFLSKKNIESNFDPAKRAKRKPGKERIKGLHKRDAHKVAAKKRQKLTRRMA